MTLEQAFPFEYVGGGYFRKKGIPKGTKAPILHGQQAIEFLYEALTSKTEVQPRSMFGSEDGCAGDSLDKW